MTNEAILDQQDIKNQDAATKEPETLEQLRSNLGTAYVEMFTALDNLTERETEESNEEYDKKHSAMCAAENKLARRYHDMRKQARESIKFHECDDRQEDDKVPADPQEKDGNDASNY
jgi:DNA replication protein DnaD